MKRNRKSRNRKGVALIIVVVISLILSILGYSALNVAYSEVVSSRNDVYTKQTFYAAEAGIEYGIAKLSELLSEQRRLLYQHEQGELTGDFSISSPALTGYTFNLFSIEKVGEVEYRMLTEGPYAGMEAIIQKYRITVEAAKTDMPRFKCKLVQMIEDQGFHLYQFAAFYEEDMEIEPGPAMDILGRIHSNHDIYLTARNRLSLQSYVTSAGDIYHDTKKPGASAPSGTVEIMDGDGDYKEMTFDSTDEDWEHRSNDRWDGKVQSSAHGITPLRLPIPDGVDPIEIIKPGELSDGQQLQDARYYYKADLRIIDGIAYDRQGNEVDLSYFDGFDTRNPIDMDKTFYNERENKTIKVTEIDVRKLIASGNFPENGIMYISSDTAGSGQQDGVRIVNGDTLPETGFTLATENPLYIQGDYNLGNAPAAVLCDAINVLSSNWDDSETDFQTACSTTINTSFVTGHTATTDSGYGGGLENLPRFLENWSGKTMTWDGSMNSLWFSEIATGQWHYGSPYYQAPGRDWGFEGTTDLSKLPPGTPVMCRTFRSSWTRQ